MKFKTGIMVLLIGIVMLTFSVSEVSATAECNKVYVTTSGSGLGQTVNFWGGTGCTAHGLFSSWCTPSVWDCVFKTTGNARYNTCKNSYVDTTLWYCSM